MKLGTWKSKTSNLTVEVKKVEDGVVWYSMKEWRTWQSNPVAQFLDCMEPVEAEPSRPSNDQGMAAGAAVSPLKSD